MTEQKYPEHQKLQAIKDKSQAIGEFLDWLFSEKDLRLAQWMKVPGEDEDSEEDELVQFWPNREELLAGYFEIDLKKLEQEKRAMLEEFRAHA